MELKVRLHYRIRAKLRSLRKGSGPARVARRAHVLLCLDAGKSVDETAAETGCGTATVKRIRRRYLDEGWERAVSDAPRCGRPRRLQTRQERELIALACTDAPDGAERWTVRLLAKHFGHGVSRATVHRVLAADGIQPWRERNVVRSGD